MECCLDAQLGGEYSFFLVFFPRRDRPIDELLEGSAKITRHELFLVDSAVDGCLWLPFPALVVGHPILWNYLPSLVDGFL